MELEVSQTRLLSEPRNIESSTIVFAWIVSVRLWTYSCGRFVTRSRAGVCGLFVEVVYRAAVFLRFKALTQTIRHGAEAPRQGSRKGGCRTLQRAPHIYSPQSSEAAQ